MIGERCRGFISPASTPHGKKAAPMPRFELHIETGNSSLADDPAYEIARILRRVASTVEDHGAGGGPLRDINGNRVGSYTLTHNQSGGEELP